MKISERYRQKGTGISEDIDRDIREYQVMHVRQDMRVRQNRPKAQNTLKIQDPCKIGKAKQVIVFKGVSKSFESKEVLKDLSFEVTAGSRIVLFGPSGSGKSTILRLISGILKPDAGKVIMNGKRLSMVFQSDRLFDELDGFDNIVYGLDYRDSNRSIRKEKAEYWAEVFHCSECLKQKAKTMSGGQRQRIALARAFIKDPDILLLDESFSSMDGPLKQELLQRILDLHKEKHFTMVFVTHSFEEARMAAEKILLLKNGQLMMQGTFEQIYANPADLFMAQAFSGVFYSVVPAGIVGGLNGWAGISAFACSSLPNENWIAVHSKHADLLDLGDSFLHTLHIDQSSIQAIDTNGKLAHTLYINPEKIRLFDLDGQLYMPSKEERGKQRIDESLN